MAKFTVKDTEITVVNIKDEDYLCLTDMLKAKDGDFFITDWLRNRNTLEYIGIWEKVYNPNFNYGEFAIIKSQAGLNSFKISVKEFGNYSAPKIPGIMQDFQQRQVLQLQRRLSHVFLLSRYKNGF